MAFKKQIANYSKYFLKNSVFYFLLFFPIVLLGIFLLQLFPFTRNDFEQNAWAYFFAAFLLFIFAWSSILLLNLILPTLIIIFFKLERVRSPKKIILLGDRFRRLGLSTPQVFIIKETFLPNLHLWKNRVYGFFSMPSPLGAIILLEPSIADSPEDALDQFICPKVINSRFGRFSSPAVVFISNFLTLCFAAAGFAKILFATNQTYFYAFIAVSFILNVGLSFYFFKSRNLFLQDRLESFFPFKKSEDSVLESKTESEKINSGSETRLFPSWAIGVIPITVFAALFATLFFSSSKESFDRFIANASTKLDIRPGQQTQLSISINVISPDGIKTALPERTDARQTSGNSSSNNSQNQSTPIITNKTAIVSTQSELSTSVIAGDFRSIIQLIGRGKNIREQDHSLGGATPLLLALKKGDTELVYLLLLLGSNLSVEVDSAGKGALFYALESPNRSRTVAYVLSGRVDIHHKALDGMTAYEYALKNGWADVTEMLSKRALASTGEPVKLETPSNNPTIKSDLIK
jgi:hypothetical protein